MIIVSGFNPKIINKNPTIVKRVYISSAAFFDPATVRCSMPSDVEKETEVFYYFEPHRPLCFYEDDHDKAALLAKLKDIYTNLFDVAAFTGTITDEHGMAGHYFTTLVVNTKHCAFETNDGRIIQGDFYYAGS